MNRATNERIKERFDQVPDDQLLMWFDLEKKTWVGRLADNPSEGITYLRRKEDVLCTLYNYHPDHIGNVIICRAIESNGLPDVSQWIFEGIDFLEFPDAVAQS